MVGTEGRRVRFEGEVVRGWKENGEGLTAVRLGQTQSNMSAPKAIQTTRSSG